MPRMALFTTVQIGSAASRQFEMVLEANTTRSAFRACLNTPIVIDRNLMFWFSWVWYFKDRHCRFQLPEIGKRNETWLKSSFD
jgi:hypothetical protein